VAEVILNGRPHDLDYYPSLQVNKLPNRRTPITINGKMVHGVNLNGYDYPPADPNCVLYFPGLPGYGSKIWDRSPYGNHGTITGATWERLPSGLWVNSFDGTDDDINCGHNSSLIISGTKTIDLWAKLFADSGSYAELWGKNLDSTNVVSLVTWDVTTSVHFYIQATTEQASIENISSVANNVFHYFTVTIDESAQQSKLYIDSVLQGTDTSFTLPSCDNADLLFGYRGLIIGGRTKYVKGLSRVWNRALSATEIAGIYQSERHLFGV
jgi:hypothetical protein